ncbi:hypothetical protein HGRIS_012344 [Hohenbuehelia grisea]|uniref:DNA helicase n=1 Tax=Hohenbuehelia grisea TaxID=104357 RepID=A0ABR3IRY8_9AGAR
MTSEAEIQAFVSKHLQLLSKERDAEVERSSLLLSNCGPKLLEQKGLALNGLGVVGVNIGLGGKTLVELERPVAHHTSPIFPPHNFRPGDLARIEVNTTSNAPPKKLKSKSPAGSPEKSGPEGVVYKVSDTRIVVALDPPSDSSSDDLDLPSACRVVKLANNVTYDRMESTMKTLEKALTGDQSKQQLRTHLMSVLMGLTPPSKATHLQGIDFFDTSLNNSQKEAVRFALEAPEVACIHGPPGTGKTHTLIEIIRQLTAVTTNNPKPQRLLVCGASNLAVDNILERLLALPVPEKGERIKVTRLGHPARVMAHQDILDATLEVKASRTDQAALAKDVKTELEAALGVLSGKGKGAKGKAPRGAERRKMWDDVKALRKEYRQREGGVVKSVLGESQIVLATCHSSGGRQLNNHTFDVVIIDEATQALEAVCWIPIFKSKKLILAGDPMQLPPTILSTSSGDAKSEKKTEKRATKTEAPAEENSDTSDDTELSETEEANVPKKSLKPKSKDLRGKLFPPKTLETTLFDRLEKMCGPSIKRMLTIQYRMHDQICTFPSKTLYRSRLKSDASVAKHLLLDLPNSHADTEDDEKEVLGAPVVFFDTSGCEYYERLDGDGEEGSRCNENEATIVKNWVETLVEAGILPEQIAVITPYQAQVTLLSSLLRPFYGQALEIGTVDGMQGREKEAVVISLVRSNDKREVGFLKEKRRLNVAMTRAKRHLCVVGDSSTVCHGGSFLKCWLAWLEANADVRYAGLD